MLNVSPSETVKSLVTGAPMDKALANFRYDPSMEHVTKESDKSNVPTDGELDDSVRIETVEEDRSPDMILEQKVKGQSEQVEQPMAQNDKGKKFVAEMGQLPQAQKVIIRCVSPNSLGVNCW